jgi:uncharacterized protein (TIGR02271 family)
MHTGRSTFDIHDGMTVVDSDGEQLGTVDHTENDAIVVRKGFFFPQDHFIPFSVVAQTDEDTIYLSITKDTALSQGWDTSAIDTWETSGDMTTDAAAPASPSFGIDVEVDQQPFTHAQDTQRTHVNADDDIMVPVHEEELTVTTRAVERGVVRVEKDVVAEEQTLDVPVTEQEVRVSRRVVDRDAVPSDTAFDEGTIEVPLYGEEVDVQKRARIREEVEISKEAVAQTERVRDTVRREEVIVEDDTDANTRTR